MTEKQPSKPIAEVTSTDVVQVLVHGALVPALTDWIRARGLEILPWPREEDELDTYMVVVAP